MLAVPLETPVAGTAIPDARQHLEVFPARSLALAGNVAGTLALVGVTLLTLRRRLVGNLLLLAGFTLAAAGSAVSGLGVSATATFVAAAAVLLYLGTVARR